MQSFTFILFIPTHYKNNCRKLKLKNKLIEINSRITLYNFILIKNETNKINFITKIDFIYFYFNQILYYIQSKSFLFFLYKI